MWTVRAGLLAGNTVDSLAAAGAFESFQDLILGHFVYFAAMRTRYGVIDLGLLCTGIRDGFYGCHAVLPPMLFFIAEILRLSDKQVGRRDDTRYFLIRLA
jgi:hypothetical protein